MPRRAGTGTRMAAVAAVAAALGCLASCSGDVPDPHDDQSCEAALGDPDSRDLFAWLNHHSAGPKRLIGGTTEDALAFAHELERHGARRITAARVRDVKGAEPFQTAEGVVVELPADPGRRLALFQTYAKVARGAGLAPRADAGQKYLFFPSKPAD